MDGGLERLCEIYKELDDKGQDELIRLAEGHLRTQKTDGETKRGNGSFRDKIVTLDSSKVGS